VKKVDSANLLTKQTGQSIFLKKKRLLCEFENFRRKISSFAR